MYQNERSFLAFFQIVYMNQYLIYILFPYICTIITILCELMFFVIIEFLSSSGHLGAAMFQLMCVSVRMMHRRLLLWHIVINKYYCTWYSIILAYTGILWHTSNKGAPPRLQPGQPGQVWHSTPLKPGKHPVFMCVLLSQTHTGIPHILILYYLFILINM